jgi:nucleoside-diphosphate-sugar epimerase
VIPFDICAGVPHLDGDLDFVIHAAGLTHPVAYATHPIAAASIQGVGTQNLLECALRCHAKRFLFCSSVEVYGDWRPGLPERFSEQDMGYLDCNRARAGYPEGKRFGEALSQAYRAEKGLDCVIARLPRVYGPTLRADDTKALSQFLHKAAAGENIALKSAGNQRYSFAYSEDVARALLTILEQGASGEAYNVASEESDISLRELAELVASVAGVSVEREEAGAQEAAGYSAASHALLDASKLRALGWRAQVGLREGVERTLAELTKK